MRKRERILASAALVAGLFAATIAPVLAVDVNVTADISVSTTWTANNTYILTKVIYVTSGATLTIEPGTVIRGEPESTPGAVDPGTLVISRGSKIRALGTPGKPIVFTDLDDDNIGANPGTNPYNNLANAAFLSGNWGGVILLGRGYVANNTTAGPDPTKEIQIEGLTAAGGLGLYGNCAAAYPSPYGKVCDDDDSGSMSYVSVRYGGFNLSANNEINGITLGAVGRSTDLDHLEVYQTNDDLVEIFGGAANVKYFVGTNGGDDGVDFDEGWRGKFQFGLVLQGLAKDDNAYKSDKGAEQDGGNTGDSSQPFSIPTLYNMTYIGLGSKASYTAKLTNTALHWRDNGGGRYYNSFFGDFGGATMCIEGGTLPSGTPTGNNTSGQRASTAYNSAAPAPIGAGWGTYYFDPTSDFQLELKNNTFWCFGNGSTIPSGTADLGAAFGCDAAKAYYDPGVFTNSALQNQYLDCNATLPIRQLTRGVAASDKPDPVIKIDPRPAAGSPLLTTDRLPPNDGFFEQVSYRGAFGPNDNWATGWTTLSRLGYFPAKQLVDVAADISTSTTWTQENEYILKQVVYVTNGATLTIEPGTVIRGEPESTPGAVDPGTLVISRGSKIRALGTPAKPIVFTDLDDDNVGLQPGTDPYDNLANAAFLSGNWGGVILLGRGYVANNTTAGPDPTKEIQIEGLTAAGGLGLYGNCAAAYPTPYGKVCDDDDSGSMSYVSVRYGGFNLSANNEINGITLGAVGRSTDLDHLEVYQTNDDLVEIFGGAPEVKYFVGTNGGDDGVDFDEGWRGKFQFGLVLQGLAKDDNAYKSDKGAEQDGGNTGDSSQPFSIPTLYNMTYIGLGSKASYTAKLTNTALHWRDNGGGRYYNSFFGDFGGATMCIEGGTLPSGTPTGNNTSGQRASTAYNSAAPAPIGAGWGTYYFDPTSDFQLELKNNTFWCFGNGSTIPNGTADQGATYGCDAAKAYYDPGVFTTSALQNQYLACASPVPINLLTRGTAATDKPDPVIKLDPRPKGGSAIATSSRDSSVGGAFFSAATYQGAFSPGTNWATGWSSLSRLGYFPTCDPINDPNVTPQEVNGLFFPSRTLAAWAPLTGETISGYDLLRAGGATAFNSGTCLAKNEAGTTFVLTTQAPAPGAAFFYLVRARNACGVGTLGFSSAGVERTGTSCP